VEEGDMARCERGYLCEVCCFEVEDIIDSDLYLRYILGEVQAEQLHRLPERHLRCNPSLTQYIVADDFEPVFCEGFFDKRNLDKEWVAAEEARVTRGWRRLREVVSLQIPIIEYPLPEFIQRNSE
jgi:hypothetical protein